MLRTSSFVDDIIFAHNGYEEIMNKGCILSDSPGNSTNKGRSLISMIALFTSVFIGNENGDDKVSIQLTGNNHI